MYLLNCKNCNLDFEVQALQKKEYTDPVFGPCAQYAACCPQCNSECSEKPLRMAPRKEKASKPLFD